VITCRLCGRKVPALQGARCARCRSLVCAECLAPGEARLCRACAAEAGEESAPQEEAAAPPADSTPPPVRTERRPRPGWEAWGVLLALLAAGLVCAFLGLVPVWRARAALRALEATEGSAELEALAGRLDRAAAAAPLTVARSLEGLPPPKRCAVIRALGRSRRVRAVPCLIGQLEGPDADVRAAAAQALWEITGEPLGEEPGAWRAWWRERGGS
jgi:hypothetical protein